MGEVSERNCNLADSAKGMRNPCAQKASGKQASNIELTNRSFSRGLKSATT